MRRRRLRAPSATKNPITIADASATTVNSKAVSAPLQYGPEESAFQIMQAWLARRGDQAPNVGVIGCQNDAMAMGARKAVEALASPLQREQWLRVPFTGVDGVPATWQAWVRQGLLAATVVAPSLTGVALEMLSRAIASGKQVPERTLKQPVSYPSIDQLRPKASAA